MISLAFGSVTSFFVIKRAFFLKTTRRICAIFFQGLGESTCSLQPALKSNEPVLESRSSFVSLPDFFVNCVLEWILLWTILGNHIADKHSRLEFLDLKEFQIISSSLCQDPL